MLFLETIDAKTLHLLEQLQALPVLNKTILVGGTALALQIGHRISVDIDLFGTITQDNYELINQLHTIAPLTILRKSENIHILLMDGIKVDIVNYPYRWLSPPKTINKIRLANLEDIAAMKLSAISGRGSKKDFIDFYFLLNRFELSQILAFYQQKYPDGSEFLVLKSLTYFEDAEKDETPLMLQSKDWHDIKSSILNAVNQFLK